MAARSGRGVGRALAVLLVVVLAAGLVVADGWARDRAEQRVNAEAAALLGTDQVTSHITGWPFALVLVNDRLETVRVVAAGVPATVDGRQTRLDSVELTASGVREVSDDSRWAERVTARVALTWDELAALVGVPLRYAGPDRVGASVPLDILGAEVTAEVEAGVELAASGELLLVEPNVVVAGVEVPERLVDTALGALAPQLRLPEVTGVGYRSLEVAPDVLVANLDGTNVVLAEVGLS